MKIKEVIGIDLSKSTFDVCVYSSQAGHCYENQTKGFKKMLEWAFKNTPFSKEETLFVFEHTGLYSQRITDFLTQQKLPFCIVPGLEIKRSLGIARGKNDQIDAKRIAQYGYRLRDELKPSKVSCIQIRRLQSLFSLRLKLVRQRAGFMASLKEQKLILKAKDYKVIFDVQDSLVRALSKEIVKLEKQMMEVIKNDKELLVIYKLITGIKGIGSLTTIAMIVYTNKFTRFETWRKFASYCGIAPFQHQSGSSIKGRSRVSHLANKELKSLLNMCAVSAIQHNREMRMYYEKRIEQGKNRMSTLNIIRNKLVARAFVVVERRTPYIDTLKYAC